MTINGGYELERDGLRRKDDRPGLLPSGGREE